MNLRYYQIDAVQSVYDSIIAGNNAPLIAMPTGTGKALTCAGLVYRTCTEYPQTRHLILSHTKEILEQDYGALRRLWPTAPVGLFSAGLNRRDTLHPIVIGGCASVRNCVDRFGRRDFCIIDECFSGETEILTPKGPKRIDCVATGDRVLNATGEGEVIAISRRQSATITIGLSNGNKIKTTAEHPFFTEKGWCSAGQLATGTRLFSRKDVSTLWDSIPPKNIGKNWKVCSRESVEQTNLLLDILQSEAQQPDERCGEPPQDARYSFEDKTCSDHSWRKWSAASATATSAFTRSWRRLARRASRNNWSRPQERCLSKLLQIRYWERGNQNRNRTRWWNTLWEKIVRRSKEGRSSEIIRVESITHNEREGAIPVFNLHVSGHPSYFANGVLVHNCHMLSPTAETTYQKIIAKLKEANPNLIVVGLTATPYRRGIGSLLNGGIFDSMAIDLTDAKSWARFIAEGYLVPLHAKRTEASIDVSGVGISNGDFAEGQLQAASDKDQLNEAIAKEIAVAMRSRKAALVFCAGIEHAEHMAERLNAHGVKTRAVHSKMPAEDRDAAIAMLRDGRLDALSSNNCLTTGLDVPRVDLIGMCRATTSVGLWIQMLGRSSRPAPGKSDALILDFVGNRPRLGPVDAPHIPKPKKGEKTGEIPCKICEHCGCYAHISARVCEACGEPFPIATKLKQRAGDQAIMSGEAPIVETFNVTRVTYARHVKKLDGAVSIRVTYMCGYKHFSRWINFDAPKNKHFAREWWRQFVGDDIPENNDAALTQLTKGVAVSPKRVRVWTNRQFPEIMGYEL